MTDSKANDFSAGVPEPTRVPAEGIAPSGKQTLRIIREGVFKAAKSSLEFIEKSEKDETVKIRIEDRRAVTMVALSFICLLGTGYLMVVDKDSRPFCAVLAVASDVFLGCAIIWSVIVRFGVLKQLDPRYAIICFHLMIGAGAMCIFFTLNIVYMLLSMNGIKLLPW
ncbi:MAG: hypothetical protein K2W95_19835 [Candidatus Obscuribacterales bacterium]|nr:hypothetical protein [Candidatus Obscuribacterales bacterium]